MARARRQIVKAIRPIKMLEKGSGKSLTSIGRPLPRSATAGIVGSEASGFVPASDINGGNSGLWFDTAHERIRLGTFDTAHEAARAYDAVAWRLGRSRQSMNFHDQETSRSGRAAR
jgi:hypothetical protein